MNITKIIAATTILAASISTYAETPLPAEKPFVSSKTRAEVTAEVAQAGGNLGRKNYEATFNPSSANVASKPHAEVVAELNKSRGNMARNNYLDTISRR
jgi:Domain of unknown function (DUF4148)